jgi:hypothetical protein
MQFRALRVFLWASILGWGIGLGAKIFDLVVVAGAWGASPPASFALLPYGKKYPIDPGDFFIPLSAVMALGLLGALVTGWRAAAPARRALLVALVAFLIIWALTPGIFWPMIAQLYYISVGKIVVTDAAATALAHRWMVWDSIRVLLIAVGFVAVVKALVRLHELPRASLDDTSNR